MISIQLTSSLSTILASEEVVRMMCRQEMMHCQSMAYNGFKRFYRYGSFDRAKHATMLENFIVENLQDQNEESIIPMYEVNFKSTVPTGSMLQQMQLIYSIAKNHINVLSSASKIALDENEDYLSDYLEKMIKDQSKELADMRRIIKQVKSAGNDEGYLRLLDSKLHEKYKVKEKEYFAFTDSKSYKY